MFYQELGNEYIILQEGTSEGTQIKYRREGYWYKLDNRGREGLAEYLASELLTYTSLSPSEYVLYEQGTINGRSGCRSRDFLQGEEELITFYRLYYNQMGKDLSQVLSRMDSMEERIEYVITFFRQSCDLDIRDYLQKVLTLDMLILNEDRHLNNFALLTADGHFKPAPIFDNGVSLLTANQSVNWHFPVEENVKRVIARPFSGSHEKMVRYLGTGFSLDTPAALEWLADEPDSTEKNVLAYQIRQFQGWQ